MAAVHHRRCARCRAALAADNTGDYCASCEPIILQLRQRPPTVPADFWQHPAIQAAAAAKHMGLLIAAYRYHPYHGVPLSQETVGFWVNMSQSQISKIESRKPDLHIDRLALWARLLGIPADLLWFDLQARSGSEGSPPAAACELDRHESIFQSRLVPPAVSIYGEAVVGDQRPNGRPTAEENDDMRRRTVLQALTAAPWAGMAGWDDRLDARISHVESSAAALRQIYHDSPSPTQLLTLVQTQLDVTADLLGQASSTGQRHHILRARSEIGALGGRLALFDLHLSHQARGFFALAYEAAVQSGDHGLASSALGHLAFVPTREGNPAAAVDYIAGAAHHASASGVHSLASWVAAVESELVAAIDPTISLQALDRADELIAASDGEPIPAWFDYYSADRLAGFRGYVLLKIGNGEQARNVLTNALSGLEPTAVKQRTVFLADIAESYLTSESPDVERACAIASDGADALMRAGYATGAQRLHALRRRLTPWNSEPAVQDLDKRLAALSA